MARMETFEYKLYPTRAQERRPAITHIAATEAATAYFEKQLWGDGGGTARRYLNDRGFTEATLRRYRVGYAPPGWDNLVAHLSAKGTDVGIMEEVDLVRRRHGTGHYDTFRNRIIFPVVSGVCVIGFGGRALDDKEDAKYINSAETPLFRKGHELYGIPQAKKAMSETRSVVLVEGYTDVLRLAEVGCVGVVATMGTASTDTHGELLRRFVESVVVCFDADEAGQTSSLRGCETLEKAGLEVRMISLPEGQDPDSYVRDYGAAAWQDTVANAPSAVEYKLETTFARYRQQGDLGLSKAASHAADIIAAVPNRTMRQELIARAAHYWAGGDYFSVGDKQRILAGEVARKAASG